MRKHMPGPWKMHKTAKGCAIFLNKLGYVRLAELVWFGDEVTEANGHLIAAAPDLLDAIKVLIVAAQDGHPGQDSYWAAVRAAESALKKAEGFS